ncbi:MAG: hypothetical protein M1840_008270 [Geoglossum simile]|nr:MAG: hypothetical protein M1840_008270 [Geoglossum simile]
MDPFTIVSSCVGLLNAIAGLSSLLRTFARDFREASKDAALVRGELGSLRTVLEMLQEEVQDVPTGAIPDSVAIQISGVTSSCNTVFGQISSVLAKYEEGGLRRRLSWTDHGCADIQNLLRSLKGHRGALDLALSTININTSQLKQDTDEILDLLRRLEKLRATPIDIYGGFLMEKFLDSLSSYAQSSADPDESFKSTDAATPEEKSYTSALQRPDSLYSRGSSNSIPTQEQWGGSARYEITTPVSESAAMTEEISASNASRWSTPIRDTSLDKATIFEVSQEGGTHMPRSADIRYDSLDKGIEPQIIFGNGSKDETAIMRAQQSRATLSTIDRISIDRALRRIDSATRAEEALAMLEQGADPNANLKIYQQANNNICAPPLYHAVVHGNIACSGALLRFGAEPNCGSHDGRLLHIAIRNTDIQATAILLRAGADVSPCAVQLAVDTANAEVVKAVLEHEATSDIPSPAMKEAVSEGQVDIVRLLLKHGATPETSILDNAAIGAQVDIVKLFLRHGVNPCLSTLLNAVGFLPTATSNQSTQQAMSLIRLLFDHGINESSQNPGLSWEDILRATIRPHNNLQLTDLLCKARNETLQRILNQGADVHSAGGCISELSDHTPLDCAILHLEKEDVDVVALLLEYGANARESDSRVPPLVHAANRGYIQTIQLLLEAGAEFDPQSILSRFKVTFRNNWVEMVELFLTRANGNLLVQETLLETAVRNKSVEMVGLLLTKAGGNLSVRETLLEMAVRDNWVEMVKLLLTKADGKTAVGGCSVEIVDLLLKAGVGIEDSQIANQGISNPGDLHRRGASYKNRGLTTQFSSHQTNFHISLLEIAISNNSRAMVGLLLEAGPRSAEVHSHFSYTALEIAQKIFQGTNEEMLNFLLWYPCANSAILYASKIQCWSTVENLLDRGADVNSTCCVGFPALYYAISGISIEAVKMLLSRGANVNFKYTIGGDSDQTALHTAIKVFSVCKRDDERYILDVIKILVEAGARPDLRAKYRLKSGCASTHVTPISMAKRIQLSNRKKRWRLLGALQVPSVLALIHKL